MDPVSGKYVNALLNYVSDDKFQNFLQLEAISEADRKADFSDRANKDILVDISMVALEKLDQNIQKAPMKKVQERYEYQKELINSLMAAASKTNATGRKALQRHSQTSGNMAVSRIGASESDSSSTSSEEMSLSRTNDVADRSRRSHSDRHPNIKPKRRTHNTTHNTAHNTSHSTAHNTAKNTAHNTTKTTAEKDKQEAYKIEQTKAAEKFIKEQTEARDKFIKEQTEAAEKFIKEQTEMKQAFIDAQNRLLGKR